jgi:hypothetical protein
MTPKEKAIELNEKFMLMINGGHKISFKKHAIIAVNEMIKYAERWGDMALDDIIEFEEIKKEIEKL